MSSKLLLAIVLGIAGLAPGASRAEPAATTRALPSAQHAAPKIVMYVMPGCGYCAQARAYLTKRGLAWREIDISASDAAAAEFERRGGQGTPLIYVDELRVHGFNAERMDAVLAGVVR